MALQASISFNGITVPEAYIRIDRVFGGKREGWNSLVNIYADQAHANDGVTQPFEQFNQHAAYDIANPNALDLVYVELAKLERFVGCTNV